jgi:hypothetical protein
MCRLAKRIHIAARLLLDGDQNTIEIKADPNANVYILQDKNVYFREIYFKQAASGCCIYSHTPDSHR